MIIRTHLKELKGKLMLHEKIVQDSQLNGLTQKPVIIHELEYYDEVVQQNVQANGVERGKEFVNWMDTL
ncbi:MAG: hypothetical protein KTR30_24075 [Saprospiraceae bacterium]|nr:hypothetical protein [Saprospiraceae bacterium]